MYNILNEKYGFINVDSKCEVFRKKKKNPLTSKYKRTDVLRKKTFLFLGNNSESNKKSVHCIYVCIHCNCSVTVTKQTFWRMFTLGSVSNRSPYWRTCQFQYGGLLCVSGFIPNTFFSRVLFPVVKITYTELQEIQIW